jgi:hypothetical protein
MSIAQNILRSEVVVRIRAWEPREYSQNDVGVEGFRNDCSGFASWCWRLPKPGTDTVGLITHNCMQQLGHPNQLKPGDAIACAGPGTGGDLGHIVMFEAWLNDDPDDNRYIGVEMAGGIGPERRVIEYPYDGDGRIFKPYRATNLVETLDDVREDNSGMTPVCLETVITDGETGERRCVEDMMLRVFKMLDGRLSGPVRLDTMFVDGEGQRQSSENCWLDTQTRVRRMENQIEAMSESVNFMREMMEKLVKPTL